MAIELGWIPGESVESYWPDEAAFRDIPKDVIAQWEVDAEGAPLLQFVKPGETPTKFVIRTLTHREATRIKALLGDGASIEGVADALVFAFRMAVTVEGMPSEFVDGTGAKTPLYETIKSVRMLSDKFTGALSRANPGLVEHFGGFIVRSIMLTGAEKKASSPPSTETASSGSTALAGATESQG